MHGMPTAVICLLTNVKIRANESETYGYMFATLEEMKAFAAEDKFLHYDSIKQAFEF